MATVEREIIKKYKLELNESEYHAFLSLVGTTTYSDFADCINREYGTQLHSGNQEKLKVLSSEDFRKLYDKLYEGK